MVKADEEQLLVLDLSSSTMGMRIHLYNPEFKSWNCKKLPSIWNDRRSFGVTLISSTLIIAGGYIFNQTPTNEVLCFNLETMKSYENPPMLQARSYFALIELNEELYAIGGLVNDEWVLSVEKFNFSLGKWKAVKPLRSILKFPSAAILNGCLYVIGQYSSAMDCFDLSSNRWYQKAVPNSKLQYVKIIGFRGFLYAICRGFENSDHCIVMERYDSSKNIWEIKEAPKFGKDCAVLGNRLFCCGLVESTQKEFIVEEYDPEVDEWKVLTKSAAEQGLHSVFTLKK